MRNKLLLLTFMITACLAANSQDIIMLRTNSNIKAKVLEVGLTEIKYKKFENPDGPIYSVLRDEVFMIKYQNGTTDVFQASEENNKPALQYPASHKPPIKALVYGAYSIPAGNFAEPLGGGANEGWGLGLFTTSKIQDRPAYFHCQLSYTIYSYDFLIPNNAGGNYDVSGNYYLWHLLFGVGGRTKPGNFAGYINFLAGANYTSVDGALEQVGYSDAFAFSVSVGGGVMVQNFALGIKYLYSKPIFKNFNSSYLTAEQKISIFQVTAGFEF